MLDIKTLEGWLWDAACKIRGEVDAPKYKDYLLPLIFLKRLSDVYDDEVTNLSKQYKNKETAEKLVEQDHSLVWFYLPKKARWQSIVQQSTGLGEYLTDVVRALARENPKLAGVIDRIDFNATDSGQRIISDDRLSLLIDKLGEHKLGIADVDPDVFGRAYEYLLRKFAEGSGQSAGEFYTPPEVAMLIAHVMDPQPGDKIYDPCMGSGGLLIKCQLRYNEKYGVNPKIKPIKLFGQEFIATTYAISKMNMFIHRMEGELALGDTMRKPTFTEKNGSLKMFDTVVANPMWNQKFPQDVYENDKFGRFLFGYPPSDSADWGWIQHMFASIGEAGKIAVVLDTMSVSRGSGDGGNDKERAIRKKFIDDDFVESVILLPDNLFYNTTSQGIILVINKNKKHKNEILLINAAHLFEKRKPKNMLPEESVQFISDIFLKWKEVEDLSKIVATKKIIDNDYNINPAKHVKSNKEKELMPIKEIIDELHSIEDEEKKVNANINRVITHISSQANLSEKSDHENKWSQVRLGDITTFAIGRTPSRISKDYWTNGTLPWVSISDMKPYSEIKKTKESVSKSALKNIFGDNFCKAGTLLMSFKLTIGRTSILAIDAVHNEAIVSIEPKEMVDRYYLMYSLPIIDFYEYMDKAVKGQTLNKGKISSLKINLPPLEYQRKVVFALDTIRKKIRLEEKKKRLLEELFEYTQRNLIRGKIKIGNLEDEEK